MNHDCRNCNGSGLTAAHGPSHEVEQCGCIGGQVYFCDSCHKEVDDPEEVEQCGDLCRTCWMEDTEEGKEYAEELKEDHDRTPTNLPKI